MKQRSGTQSTQFLQSPLSFAQTARECERDQRVIAFGGHISLDRSVNGLYNLIALLIMHINLFIHEL